MKPLISYYGGKQRMASKIVPLIPPHTVYVEPFAGGASVFYAKPKPIITNGHHYREVLNDINGDLLNAYCEAQRDPIGFSASLMAIPMSVAVYRSSIVERGCSRCNALRKIIRHEMSFSNKDAGGFSRNTFGRDFAKSWATKRQSSLSASRRLNNVTLDSICGIKCIEIWDSPQTFFYVDPPYLGTSIQGMGKWGIDDLSRLCTVLNQARGSFVVSGYNEMRGILNYRKRLSFAANCTATGSGKSRAGRNHGEPIKGIGRERTEQLYMRGPTAPVRSSLIPVLEKQTCFTGPLLGPCPLPLKTHPSARKAAALSN